MKVNVKIMIDMIFILGNIKCIYRYSWVYCIIGCWCVIRSVVVCDYIVY